jgi:RNA polymerase sigma-70 factor (ECF subfamily)
MIRSNDQTESARIARGLKDRDPRAMEQLYDAYGSLVYGRVYSILRNEAVAEDLVQDVFFTVWQRAKVFDETRGSLATWLIVLAHNRAIDYLRTREARVESKTAAVDLTPIREGRPTPEQNAVQQDMFGRLRGAMARLTLNQRTVLKLAFEDGLSHTEVAARLSKPLGTVKTQIRSAIHALRVEMTECEAGA